MVRKSKENPAHVLSIILAGGAGKRLFPLTQDRSKPAVPLGGKYRLIDVPISNCLNSGLPVGSHIWLVACRADTYAAFQGIGLRLA